MKLEDVFENCLKEIIGGNATAADCQARFPNIPDLEAHLRLAQRFQAASALTIRPEVSRRQAETLQRYVRVHYQPSSPRTWAGRSMLAACTIVLMVFGLVNVSGHSLPGESLYGLKRTMETAQLTFTPLHERADTYLQQAQQRLTEIEQLAQQGETDPTLLTNLLTDLATTTEAAIAAVGDFSSERQTAMWDTLLQETERQETVLAALETALPTAVQPTWELTRQTASESHATAVLHVMHDSPPLSASFTPTSLPSATFTWTPTAIPTRRPVSSPTHVLPTVTQSPSQPTPELPDSTDVPTLSAPPTQIATVMIEPTATTEPIESPEPTHEPGGGGGQPDCRAGNPNAPGYCTPTPLPPEPTAMPTACPTSPGGHPQCH